MKFDVSIFLETNVQVFVDKFIQISSQIDNKYIL